MATVKPPSGQIRKKPARSKQSKDAGNKPVIPVSKASGPTDKPPPQEVKTLTFKVPKTFHKKFKQYATDNDISMTDLLYSMYEEYRKKHG